MTAKLNLTDEERKARKNEAKRRYYLKHKGSPEYKKRMNDANLARYHTKKNDPEFIDKLKSQKRARYQLQKDDPSFKQALSDKYRRLSNARMWDGVVRHAVKRAIVRSLPYDQDLLEWAPTVWTGRCALSGIEFKRNVGMGPGPFSPSIDRIRPELGYTKENCRFILHAINAMKGSGSDEEMLLIARALVAASEGR